MSQIWLSLEAVISLIKDKLTIKLNYCIDE